MEEILIENDLRIGRVNFGGVLKRVCLDFVPEIKVGEYAVVHVGFALSVIDAESAEKTLEIFRQMGALDEELATEEEAFARAAVAPQSACPDGSCSTEHNSANAANSASPATPQASAAPQVPASPANSANSANAQ